MISFKSINDGIPSNIITNITREEALKLFKQIEFFLLEGTATPTHEKTKELMSQLCGQVVKVEDASKEILDDLKKLRTKVDCVLAGYTDPRFKKVEPVNYGFTLEEAINTFKDECWCKESQVEECSACFLRKQAR